MLGLKETGRQDSLLSQGRIRRLGFKKFEPLELRSTQPLNVRGTHPNRRDAIPETQAHEQSKSIASFG